MCVWAAAPVPVPLMGPVAISAPRAIAVQPAPCKKCPVSLELTVLSPERRSAEHAPKAACAPPQPLKNLLSARLVRIVEMHSSLHCKESKESLELISIVFQGHFCPAGAVLPQPCPSGTYSNQTGAHSVSVCTPCPSGRYCSSLGSSTPQGELMLINISARFSK